MESHWILVLETACRGELEQASASSDHSHESSSSSSTTKPTFRQSTIDAWKNHSATAFLECDIALFPEDLTLSREDFLAFVWRLPRQNLFPCGHENLLLFPPMNVTEYSIALSACQLQGTTIFTETLAVSTATDTTDAAVVWQDGTLRSRKKIQEQEPFMAHVQVILDVNQASQEFYRRVQSKTLLEEHGVDTHVLPFMDPTGSNKTEIMLLLESIKAKIEGDVRAVDQILTFMAIVSLFLVISLIKLVFFDGPIRKPRRTPQVVRLADPTAPPSAWLAARGVGTGNMIFRTPLTTNGNVPGAAPATMVSSGTIGASPCTNLAMEWTRRKDERRRNRPLDIGPRRLIPPTRSNMTEEEDEPTVEPSSEEGSTTPRVETAERKTLTHPPQDAASSQEHIVPERLARTLWGFGV
eukprot:scaffold6091_cov164-Amphora_coffeaeformis.AAC.5